MAPEIMSRFLCPGEQAGRPHRQGWVHASDSPCEGALGAL